MRNSSMKEGMASPETILLIKLDEIGDMILASPALEFLRCTYPRARITMVLRPEILPLVERCPYVDRFVTMPRYSLPGSWRKLVFMAKSLVFCLRNRMFRNDMSFVLHSTPYAQECIFSFVALARIRAGCLNPDIYWSRLCFNDSAPPPARHEVERILSIAKRHSPQSQHDIKLHVWLCDADYGHARRSLYEGISYIAVGCNATKAGYRSWPVEKYAEMIRLLHADYPDYQFLVVGGNGDKGIAGKLVELTGSYVNDLSGGLTLRESCATLSRCVCFVGNDSGPMHMAAAVGIPVVEVSGCPASCPPDHHNAPERFGPYGVESIVCRPGCARGEYSDSGNMFNHISALDIGVDQVLAAVENLLTSIVDSGEERGGGKCQK